MKHAGLPRIRLHDVRHTNATLLLKNEVSDKVVSERLGHSTTAFTKDYYAHVIGTMDREAASALDAALVKGQSRC